MNAIAPVAAVTSSSFVRSSEGAAAAANSVIGRAVGCGRASETAGESSPSSTRVGDLGGESNGSIVSRSSSVPAFLGGEGCPCVLCRPRWDPGPGNFAARFMIAHEDSTSDTFWVSKAPKMLSNTLPPHASIFNRLSPSAVLARARNMPVFLAHSSRSSRPNTIMSRSFPRHTLGSLRDSRMGLRLTTP